MKPKAPMCLLDPAVIRKLIKRGNRLNREMAKQYPNHPNWKVYK